MASLAEAVYNAEFFLSFSGPAVSVGVVERVVPPGAELAAFVEAVVSGTSGLHVDLSMAYNEPLSVVVAQLAARMPSVVHRDTSPAFPRKRTCMQGQPAVRTLQVLDKHQEERQDKLEPGTTLAEEELHTS